MKLRGQVSPRSRKGSLKKSEEQDPNSAEASSRMLQEAFSTLSLTEKIALSISDNQSMISERDKESLRHALKLMGPKELARVEDEVRYLDF